MNFLEIELSGRTLMIMGALLSIAFVLLIIWLARLYSKKKQA